MPLFKPFSIKNVGWICERISCEFEGENIMTFEDFLGFYILLDILFVGVASLEAFYCFISDLLGNDTDKHEWCYFSGINAA